MLQPLNPIFLRISDKKYNYRPERPQSAHLVSEASSPRAKEMHFNGIVNNFHLAAMVTRVLNV